MTMLSNFVPAGAVEVLGRLAINAPTKPFYPNVGAQGLHPVHNSNGNAIACNYAIISIVVSLPYQGYERKRIHQYLNRIRYKSSG
jgi:hypothetical protein